MQQTRSRETVNKRAVSNSAKICHKSVYNIFISTTINAIPSIHVTR